METLLINLFDKMATPENVMFLICFILLFTRMNKIEDNIAIKMLRHCLKCKNYEPKESED